MQNPKLRAASSSLPFHSNTMQYKLGKDTELRFEVEAGETVVVRLVTGHAEIFGSELLPLNDYTFPELSKVAVFTWHGCNLQLAGKPEVAYAVQKTPMMIYMNMHAGLEQIREDATTKQVRGPCVMVVGPANGGMSTICKLLLNYAVRLNRKPLFIDLDVAHNDIAVPGTIGSVLIERPSNVVSGFNTDQPITYHYGHTHPNTNPDYYNHIVSKMAQSVDKKLLSNRTIDVSGCIINTHSWAKEDGLKCLSHIAQEFEIGIILVVESERLLSELGKVMPQFVRMRLLPKSGGVVEKNKEHRAKERFNKIHEYFYGVKDIFYPFSFDITGDDVKIFKIGARDLPASLLPLGMQQGDNKKKLIQVNITKSLLNHILSASQATSEDTILDSNIGGFLVVTAVNVEKHSFTVISPAPRPLPFTYLLLNDAQHLEMS